MAITDARPVVIVAADAREFGGLLSHCDQQKALGWPLDYVLEANLRGQQFILVANGPGPHLARQAIREVIGRRECKGVLSVGFCGGLEPGLAVGDLLVPEQIVDGQVRRTYQPQRWRGLRRTAEGTLLSVDRVIQSAGERRRLWEQGFTAVEMEAAAVAQVAEEAGIPFYCARVVTDAGAETFVLNFNEARSSDGRFSVPRLLWQSVRSPAAAFPELLRLEQRSRLAAKKLGEFLADCAVHL